MSSITTPVETTWPHSSASRLNLIATAAALALLWFFLCRHLSGEWSLNEQYNYGWFVPVFAIFLLWMRWNDRPDLKSEIRNPKSEIAAAAAAVAALLLLLPLRLFEIANPDWRLLSWLHGLAVVAITLFFVWRIGGNPWLRHFAFPIAFILVAVPWPSAIELPLTQGLMPAVASIAAEGLAVFGIPAQVQGNLIHVGHGLVGVNEACSGVRSLQTAFMNGLLFGELARLSVLRRVALLAGTIAIALLANCVRTFFLVWIAATRGLDQVERLHDSAGYSIVVAVFLGSIGLAWLLRRGTHDREIQSEKESTRRGGAPGHFGLALPVVLICWLILVEVVSISWYRAHETNLQPTAQWRVRWPEEAKAFHKLKIDERTRSILRCNEESGATWRERSDDALASGPLGPDSLRLLYFFRWYPGHNSALMANLHRPDVCLPATGWRQLADHGVRQYQVADNLSIPFRHFVFGREERGRTEFVDAFYCLWEERANPSNSGAGEAAGQPSAWTRSERIEAVRQGRRHLGQRVLEYMIMHTREAGAEETEQVFAGAVPNLIERD